MLRRPPKFPPFPSPTLFRPGRFRLKAAALAMPLRSVTPWDPGIKADNPPKLELGLEPGTVPASVLHCYENGPEMSIHWQDAAKTRLVIQAAKTLDVGRDRYNCTAYVGGRYYWYSHMWLLAPGPE